MDCGHCDFCCDKPKFGGSNQKRQKCRWRQCLQFAMVGGARRASAWEWWAGQVGSVVSEDLAVSGFGYEFKAFLLRQMRNLGGIGIANRQGGPMMGTHE